MFKLAFALLAGVVAAADLQATLEAEGAVYAMFWSPTASGDKVTPTDHYVAPARAAYLKEKRGDDRSFPKDSYGVELAKDQSAIGRVWASGGAETVNNPGDDAGFARQALAKEFNIKKISMKAQDGGVLEWGHGPTKDEL